MDATGPRARRSRLLLALLLCLAAVAGLVAAGLWPARGGHARATPPPPAAEREAPAPAESARARTAAELTAALLAECAKTDAKPERSGTLEALLRDGSETEKLAAAAALFELGTRPAVDAASRLALAVLGNKRRRITGDEASAILLDALARFFSDPQSDLAGKLLAGQVLAAVRSPRVTELLLQIEGPDHTLAFDLLSRTTDPGSVLVLSRAVLAHRGPDQTALATALCGSAEGRAELRRLLDPAGGFHWAEHMDAKMCALRVLGSGFREADDLAAIDAAIRSSPGIAPTVNGVLSRRSASPFAANLELPPGSVQAEAIAGFLVEHAGSPIEDALVAVLGRINERFVDPLLPRLEAARPGMRDRVAAARRPAK